MLKEENRLKTTYEFNKTRRLGRRYRGPLFDVFYLDVRNYDGPSRIGIVATIKFDKSAVKRNRVKRVFREVVRLNLSKIKGGFWIVIHPKKITIDKGYEEINTEFNKVLPKIFITR